MILRRFQNGLFNYKVGFGLKQDRIIDVLNYFIAFLCVVGIAIGQVLFKLTAASLARTGSFFATNTLTLLVGAFALYGLTTVAWIWVLQKVDLGRIYPFMALAFVMVPIGSYIFLDERFTSQYFVGVAVIIVGILIVVKS